MSSETQLCDYEFLPEGIHKMTYHAVGRDAVNAYFAHFERAISETADGAVIRCITDGRLIKQTQPVTYLLSRTRIALHRHPHRPIFRVGIVSQDNSMVPIMDNLFRMIARGRDKLRFFGANQYQEAVDWLLQEP
jgi:hypothetical protein